MPITYDVAKESDNQLLEKTMKEYHTGLYDFEVRVGLLKAYGSKNDDGVIKTFPLKKAGAPCAAKVKIVSMKDRLTKNLDAEIFVDGDLWDKLTERKKQAILDHELEHIKLNVDKEGEVKMDDLDRPKLKLIPDDMNFWGFSTIVERYGADSQEYQCFQKLVNEFDGILPTKSLSERKVVDIKIDKETAEHAGHIMHNVVNDILNGDLNE